MSVTSQANIASSQTIGAAKASAAGGQTSSQASPGEPGNNPGLANKEAISSAKPDTFEQFGRKKAQKPLIIHRDAHSIVLANHQLMYKTERKHGEKILWGHNADDKKKYVAVGNFINVINVIEDIKANLPNTKALKTQSHKYIQNEKRDPRSIYKEGAIDPHRTVTFMDAGFKELKCEPKKQGTGKRKEAQRFDLQ